MIFSTNRHEDPAATDQKTFVGQLQWRGTCTVVGVSLLQSQQEQLDIRGI